MSGSNKGDTADNAKITNLVNPFGMMTLQTSAGPIQVDVKKFAAAAERIGADKLDVLSIGGYRNAKGELVADYDSVRIERKA